MDRSLGLIGLGVLFLAGGWALEKMRRRILAHMARSSALAQSAAAEREGRCAMKIGRFTLSGVSVALLVIQLALVSSIAAKYLYQRWRCPRVWTRTAAIDPELPMRGRYLSLQLTVDGCQSTLPSAKLATFPRDVNGAVKPGAFSHAAGRRWCFRANLKVENNRWWRFRVRRPGGYGGSQEWSAWPGARLRRRCSLD